MAVCQGLAVAELRIALDMTPAAVGHTGVVRYAEKIWETLGQDPRLELRGVSFGRTERRLPDVRHVPVPLRVLHPLWRLTGQPKVERFTGPVDVVHSTDLLPPPSRAALVVSIHDVLPATHPQFYSERARRTHEAKLAAVKRADVIVTLTQASADEIAVLLDMPADHLVVAGSGGIANTAEPLPASVASPFLLTVGVVTPRKAFEVLARAVAALGPDAPTVVHVGPDGFRAEEVRAAIDEVDVHRKWRFLGTIDDGALAGLYEAAEIVCHPSLAEGLGLVCLEAMERSTPVIAADIPSVREVTSGAAVLVPPGDADAFAGAIESLVADPGERDRLCRLGRERASAFSWEATAAAVADAYRLAAGDHAKKR